MDRSGLKFFPLQLLRGGVFSASWIKVAGNCMKWIDPVLNFFPLQLLGRGVFSASWIKVAGKCNKWIDPVLNLFHLWLLGSRRGFASWTKVAGNCMKWIEFFPSSVAGVGGLFYQLNQVAGNCMKWIDPVLIFSLLSLVGGGDFSASWTEVAANCMKWIDPVLNFPSSVTWGGGLFCQLNQICWKLYEMDRSSLNFFPLQLWAKGGFSASWTKVAGNCMKWIDPVLIFSLIGY